MAARLPVGDRARPRHTVFRQFKPTDQGQGTTDVFAMCGKYTKGCDYCGRSLRAFSTSSRAFLGSSQGSGSVERRANTLSPALPISTVSVLFSAPKWTSN